MPTEDFIIELFCQVDDNMLDATKHSQATLFPSEVVTIALLFVPSKDVATGPSIAG